MPRPVALAPPFLVLLVACSSARVTSVPVPPPRAPFALALAAADQGAPSPLAQVDVTGVLEVVTVDRASRDLVVGVRDGTRLVTAALPQPIEAPAVGEARGRPVRLQASVTADAVDLDLSTTDDGRVLLLVASRRFADRLPGRPEDWAMPADLPVRRVAGTSVLRTTGDENDCVALSVHYPLEVVGGPLPLRLPTGAWQAATWRGHAVSLMNREAWWIRRSSCANVQGAGATVLVRAEPEAAAAPLPAR